MNTISLIIQVGSLISALGIITAVLKKQVSKDIKNMDYNNCKSYLTDFLAEISQGIPKTDIQRLRACEIYGHYIKELQGNSYIEKEWNKWMK